jgi:hypothetical protein
MWFKTFVATLVLSATIFAQDVVGPKAVITDANGGTPPEEVQAGEALYLSAAQSVAGDKPNSIIWIIKPKARADRSKTYGRELCIPLGTKECDLVILQIAALGDEASYAEITIHVKGDKVEPGPGPGPGPNPPPPPPITSLSQMVATELKAKIGAQVTIPDALRLAALSATFKDLAGKVDRGEITTIDQLLDKTKEQTMSTTGADYVRLWKDIKAKIERELQTLGDAGKLPDVKAHAPLWLEVAKGIDTALGV